MENRLTDVLLRTGFGGRVGDDPLGVELEYHGLARQTDSYDRDRYPNGFAAPVRVWAPTEAGLEMANQSGRVPTCHSPRGGKRLAAFISRGGYVK